MKIRNVIQCRKMGNNGYNICTNNSGRLVTVLAVFALLQRERWVGTLIQLRFFCWLEL